MTYWQQLLLNWVYSNQNGDYKPFIPRPYTWKTYTLGSYFVSVTSSHYDWAMKKTEGT